MTYFTVRYRHAEGPWQAIRVFTDEAAANAFAAQVTAQYGAGHQIEIISWFEATNGKKVVR